MALLEGNNPLKHVPQRLDWGLVSLHMANWEIFTALPSPSGLLFLVPRLLVLPKSIVAVELNMTLLILNASCQTSILNIPAHHFEEFNYHFIEHQTCAITVNCPSK